MDGKSCQHELRGDVVICPLPSSLQLDKDGVPLQVGSSAGPRPTGDGGQGLWTGPELLPALRSAWIMNVTSWAG